MLNCDYFRNKDVIVVGFARTGLACANLLWDLGAKVSVTDNKLDAATRNNLGKLKDSRIKVELGRHSQEFLKDNDLMIVSPGVPNDALPLAWAKDLKIPVISEIELSWILCPATVVAVTGTNGKTTVTTLIGKVLEENGDRVYVCGNIGRPFAQEVEKLSGGDFVALEVSSFQLEGIVSFKPKISVILNFSSNHLDRYKDMDEYLAAKKRIFMNQDKNDYLVLNQDHPVVSSLAQESVAKVVYFSSEKDGLNPNQSAVLAVSSILGIDRQKVLKVFREFKGVEHRLETVQELNGVKFINDSKATTVDATAWALENISEPVILIAGGREKGNDYSLIKELIAKKVKKIILIGEAKERMEESFRGLASIDKTQTLEEAVRLAHLKARAGDFVLLSPMCKSFDMFSDYEERGRFFKKAVSELAKENA